MKIKLIFLVILFVVCECTLKSNDGSSESRIEFDRKRNFLRIANFKEGDSIPDTLRNRNYSILYIESPELRSHQTILDAIGASNLQMLMISNFNEQDVFSLDLTRFKNLEELNIQGNRLREIQFKGNLACKLKTLDIHSDSLEFPEFDSSFLTIETFRYTGVGGVIPRWIEELKNLDELSFASKTLKEIQCNVCNMESIFLLDISGSDYYNHEMEFFRKYGRYDKLDDFIKCKPRLEFKYKLPGY